MASAGWALFIRVISVIIPRIIEQWGGGVAALPRVIERGLAHVAATHAAPRVELLAVGEGAVGLGRHAHAAEVIDVSQRQGPVV